MVGAPPEALPAGLRGQVKLLLPVLRLLGPVGPVRSAILANLLSRPSAADPGTRRVVLDSLARPTRASMALAVRSFVAERGDAAALAPDARAVAVAGASTLVPLEQPAALAAELAAELCPFWCRLER